MKKIVFSIVTTVLVLALMTPIVIWVLNNYHIHIYPKNVVPEYLKIEANARVTGSIFDDLADDGRKTKKQRRLNTRVPHPYSGYKPQAAVKGVFSYYPLEQGKKETDDTKGKKQDFYINALGFRSENLSPQKSKGTIRIAMLGGSAVFLGSTNEKTIVAFLASLLEQNGLTVEYINAGIVSGVTSQELAVLVQDLVDLDVDLLVTLDGFNDIFNITYKNGRVGWPFYFEVLPGVVWPRYYPQLKPTKEIPQKKLIRGVYHYLHTIKKMGSIAKTFKMKYIAAVQPCLYYTEGHDRIIDPHYESIVVFFKAIVDAFAKYDNERDDNSHYLSLATIVPPELYWDAVHFSDQGNAIVAGALFELIKEREILPLPGAK